MVIELERHFAFWSDKISAIHAEAVKAIEKLGVKQEKSLEALLELQHNMHPLMPKCTKVLQENKEIETQLINVNE